MTSEKFLNEITTIFAQSACVKQATLAENAPKILEAAERIVDVIQAGGKVLIFGNGGSSADSQHMAAELIGRFQKERQSFPAIALTTDTSVLTALANDYSFDIVFSRQLEGLGRKGDLAIAISTSGNALNVINGVNQARQMGMTTMALTGKRGGQLASLVDVSIIVPSEVTARIQETHICIIHCICELVEKKLSP
jgi:D-sedoheptulose 7-phosphate isomerase